MTTEVTDSNCAFNITSMMMEQGNYTHEIEIFSRIKKECMHMNAYSSEEMKRNLTREFPEYMMPHIFLTLYIPPVLLCLGTIGNMLSFVIMARNMLKGSTYIYLAVLAIMDLLVLYIGLLRMWIGTFSIDIQQASNFLCKIVNFLGFVSSHMSVWLIIAVTMERFIAVKCPLRAPRMCTVHRARRIILSILILICGLNVHIFWTVELKGTPHNGIVCEATEVYSRNVLPWVDAAIYSFIPFVIITIINSLIVRQVVYARKRRSHMQHTELTTMHSNIARKSQVKKSCEGSKKLTVMLLAVSCTFVLTTLPMNLLQIVSAFTGRVAGKRFAQMTLGRTIVELLMYVNHSINFFLYCATGRKFRLQVRDLLCMCCHGICCRKCNCTEKHVTSGSPTRSYHISRINSNQKLMMIECNKRFIVAQNSR